MEKIGEVYLGAPFIWLPCSPKVPSIAQLSHPEVAPQRVKSSGIGIGFSIQQKFHNGVAAAENGNVQRTQRGRRLSVRPNRHGISEDVPSIKDTAGLC